MQCACDEKEGLAGMCEHHAKLVAEAVASEQRRWQGIFEGLGRESGKHENEMMRRMEALEDKVDLLDDQVGFPLAGSVIDNGSVFTRTALLFVNHNKLTKRMKAVEERERG